jgi:UDP-N-acetylglucosamine--N-acetylmuramyl-(pentapeptide) pyrophosphoryl-undecaprenol N-acetylglucosamine transferase
MDKYFPAEKIVLTGNPVREELIQRKISREKACEHLQIPVEKLVLLVLGGSLGARTLNDSLLSRIDAFEQEHVFVLWQTGKLYYNQIRKELDGKDLRNVRYFDFIARMDLAYAVADVIVSRAGAATISEICLLGKPAILVPSPNVAEDHQTKNAMALVKNNAALMIPDHEAREKLVPLAIGLLNNLEQRKILGANAAKMALPDAASLIVNEIFKLVKKSEPAG